MPQNHSSELPPYSTSPLLAELDCIQHGFFGVRGGVSEGEYASLNCGRSSSDSPSSVMENRQRVAQCFGVHEQDLYSLCQVHSAQVVRIHAETIPQFSTKVDGMVSNTENIALGALGADCAPVLFVDPINRVIGAAHSGWKGALIGINEAVIEQMCALGASIHHIQAAIGPAMQQAHYEVKQDFKSLFLQDSMIDAEPFFIEQQQKLFFDTPAYIHARLVNAGVQQIDISNEDTFSQPDKYFSYRRACQNDAIDYGRQIAVIALKPE